MTVLPPDDVIALLRRRLTRLEEMVAVRRAELGQMQREVPRLFLAEDEYALAMLQAEAAWVRSLFNELVTGAHPDLAGWREWHRSGAVPADLAELAETGYTDAESSRNESEE
jgi:hypothetical protein